MTVHSCDTPKAADQDRYGPAIDGCWERPDGRMWVANDEYSSQVNFCPYCGTPATVKIGEHR